MKKTLILLPILILSGLLLTSCAKAQKPKEVIFACKQEGVLAPKWTCTPYKNGYYAGLGIAQKSIAGINHMRRVALANGRSDLAQQISSTIKDKVETFTRSIGNGSEETVDSVYSAVSKQIAKVNLNGSKAIDSWQSPSGNLYLLVVIAEKNVNTIVKNTIKTSFKNDKALWQQFQSQKALEVLDKEFPTD